MCQKNMFPVDQNQLQRRLGKEKKGLHIYFIMLLGGSD